MKKLYHIYLRGYVLTHLDIAQDVTDQFYHGLDSVENTIAAAMGVEDAIDNASADSYTEFEERYKEMASFNS